MSEQYRDSAPENGGSDDRLARLRAISEATLAVSSELDLDSVLQKVVDTARDLVGARYAALGIAKRDMSGLGRFIVSGVTRDQIEAMGSWPRGHGVLGALLHDPKPLRLRRLSDDPRSVGFPSHHPSMTSFLGVPIRSGERILGNFYLTDKLSAEEFSQDDEDILVIFATHVAVAIENARRFTETSARLARTLLEIRRAEQRSQFLVELSTLLPLGPIVDELPWEKMIRRATDLLGDGCAVLLSDPEDEQKCIWMVQHRDASRVESMRKLLDESQELLVRDVIQGRNSLFVVAGEDGGEEARGLDTESMKQAKFSAIMAMPVCTEQRSYGAFISLASQPMVFSDDDLTFGSLIADRMGVALENAELVRQLKRALQARDEFVSIATHELKTPITVLKGYAQTLLARSASGGELERRALVAINSQTSRLVNLINELLDVSRIRAGRLELSIERFDLVELCHEVLERFSMLEGDGSAKLELKATEAKLLGDWDRSRVEQVLTNLISNAIKYSPNGGTIVLEVTQSDGEALVSVVDQGIGIPKAQQQQIFDTFERGRNAREMRIEGAGLGLHISREIVERHGGRIWFSSAEGEGTTFSFALPLSS